MRLRAILYILLLGLTAPQMVAGAPLSIKDFLATRKATATLLSLAQLRSDPAAYAGKVFEVRGRISGFASSPSGRSMIVADSRGESFLINVRELPNESPGCSVACLVRVGKDCTLSLSDLNLVAWTYEADLAQLEQAQRDLRPAVTSRSMERPRTGKVVQKISLEYMVPPYANAIRGFNPRLSAAEAENIARGVIGFSAHYKVDPRLVVAVILAESHFRTDAVSSKGAMGLGQLMPGTAAGLGVNNAFDPVQNLYGSVRYIRSVIDRTSGKKWQDMTWNDLALALAAYNAGPNAVRKHGGIPPYKQTMNYIRKVTSIYRSLCKSDG